MTRRMTIAMHGGRPPVGKGVFARNDGAREGVDYLARFDFVALNSIRDDTESLAAALMARGVEVWLYSTPGYWTPRAWRRELARITAQCEAIGCAGIVANPEYGWSRQRAEAERFGAALADVAAGRVRVGVVSVPLWPALEALAAKCRGAVWGAPELYAKTAWVDGSAERRAHMWGRWTHAFGELRTVVAFSLWFRTNGIIANDAPSFRAYLASLPRSAAGIGWLAAGREPAWSLDAVDAWQPAGTKLHGWILAAAAWITSPAGAAVAAAVVLVVAGGVVLA